MRNIALMCFAVLVSNPSHAQFAGSRNVDYPTGGVQLGNGWSSLDAAKTAGGCVEFSEKIDLAEDRNLYLKRVADKEQLNRTLDISVEITAKALTSDLGASAKATFSKAIEVKNDELNIVTTAWVRQGARYVAPKEGTNGVRLTEAAMSTLSQGLKEFYAVCGDGFVSAIYGGGEMHAVLQFKIASTDERETVHAELKSKGITYGGSAEITNTLKKYRESSRLSIFMHAAGGTGIPLAVDEVSLLDRIKNLPADAKTAPRNYAITITRYDKLANWPGQILPQLKFGEIDALVGQYLRYQSLYLDMFDMIEQPSKYSYIGFAHGARVKALQDHLRMAILPALKNRLNDCLQGKTCELPEMAKGTDYEFRGILPVKIAGMSTSVVLREAQLESNLAYEGLRRNPAFRRGMIGGRHSVRPNPAHSAALERSQTAQRIVDTLLTTYPQNVAVEMYQQWIQIPSYIRCVENGTSNYCLSQAELSAFKEKIIKDMIDYSKGVGVEGIPAYEPVVFPVPLG